MLNRTVAATLVALLFATGCHATTYSAVSMPKAQTREDDTCFAQCQSRRENGNDEYLDCVRNCPGAAVHEGNACNDVQPIPNYVCTDVEGRKFSVGRTVILAVVLGVVAAVAIGAGAAVAASSSGSNPQ